MLEAWVALPAAADPLPSVISSRAASGTFRRRHLPPRTEPVEKGFRAQKSTPNVGCRYGRNRGHLPRRRQENCRLSINHA